MDSKRRTTEPARSAVSPRVREATREDAPGYVEAMLAGYEMDPQFVYRYPYRKQYPDDARSASIAVVEAAIENPNTVVLVAELPVPQSDNEAIAEEDWKIAAVATWEWKTLDDVESGTHPPGFSAVDSPRRDMDPTRQAEFIDAITAAERRCFGPQWGQHRMELADLACHPAFQRRGAATALTRWGMAKASLQGVPVMLTASPMGRKVYLNLGFRELDYFEVGGGIERIGTWVMVWTPDGWEAPK
ncbi:uncharacterized protein PV09_00041 [Verruconis gallopava]|uniref:N-acetyltransferase domain-containing protein n=1 Tax=Verruconis gallopava TaxID=253628 RepID=A0A0D1Y232_9PEZI|nr:uncharacterized protein PV09_00041 [Verruconis gallopava]KIW09096.1 hypothetical protein PV09_00041 [Verruconis gallopava]